MVTPANNDPYAPTTPGKKPAAAGTVPVQTLIGRRLGDYEIVETLGEGGMGIVYRAKDATLDREVALKVLQPFLAQDEEYERRFIREAKTAAKLDHPNIVSVFAAGRGENVLFMAMQLVRGETLHQLLKRRKRLPVAEALALARQAALGLEAAHQAGLVHRDIKPNNIMVDREGRVKIMDFGLMRSKTTGEAITQRGDFFGTPEYASPEQCETSELDGRSDLYSLGVVLYQMLTGRMPHRADTPMALFKKILHEKPVAVRRINPKISGAVETLVQKLMAKSPADRFRNAQEAVRAIDEAMKANPAVEATRTFLRLGAGAAAVLVAAALALFGIGLFKQRGGTEPVVVPPPKSERFKLAILDFRNGTPDAATNYYEIALSDLLIASLSQYPGLDVPSRETLMWTHGGSKETIDTSDADRLARGLGATAYVTGKYYVRGGKIRVTLSGYRLPGREPLFGARSFEKTEAEVFALVDEAAKAIARDLESFSAPAAAFSASDRPKPCLEIAQAWKPDAPIEELGKSKGNDDKVLALAEKSAAPRAAAEPVLRQGAPQAPPPAPTTGAPAPRPGNQERRKQMAMPAMSDPELVKAWYQNRHALEQCNFQKEDFDALTRSLRSQFQAGPSDAASFQKGVENFRAGIDRLKDAHAKSDRFEGGPAKPVIDFACPSCGTVSPEFARCEPCDRYLVMRIKLPGTAPEKKKE